MSPLLFTVMLLGAAPAPPAADAEDWKSFPAAAPAESPPPPTAESPRKPFQVLRGAPNPARAPTVSRPAAAARAQSSSAASYGRVWGSAGLALLPGLVGYGAMLGVMVGTGSAFPLMGTGMDPYLATLAFTAVAAGFTSLGTFALHAFTFGGRGRVGWAILGTVLGLATSALVGLPLLSTMSASPNGGLFVVSNIACIASAFSTATALEIDHTNRPPVRFGIAQVKGGAVVSVGASF